MSTISFRSLSFSTRANWEWTDAPWQTRALLQIPATFIGLGTVVFIAGVISVVVARGRRAIFATLTTAVLTFVVIRALTFANYAIQYLADIWDNIGTMQSISSAIVVLSGFQTLLDITIFLLVLRDRKHAFTELAGPLATKPAIGHRLLNVLMAVMLVIVPVLSLARGIINRIASESVQAGSISRHKYNDLMRTSRILVHIWTGAFGIAVIVLGVKAFGLRRRLASIGLRDVPTFIMLTVALPILLAEVIVHVYSDAWFSTYRPSSDDHLQANVLFSVSLLSSMLPFAYYLVIACLGFMQKLWTTTSSMQRVSSRTTHNPKFESTSTV